MPSFDTYMEKDLSINDEIDAPRRLDLVLLLRLDTIVVALVSCIYGLGPPDEYRDRIVALAGRGAGAAVLLRRLVELQYSRTT